MPLARQEVGQEPGDQERDKLPKAKAERSLLTMEECASGCGRRAEEESPGGMRF